jgi:hypothetical protein
VSGPSRILETSQIPAPSPDVSEIPLFEPDSSSQIAEEDQPIMDRGSPHLLLSDEDRPIVEQGSRSPPLPSLPLHADDEEFRAMEEMRDQFQWLVDMLDQNKNRGWGTAYRDFADVSLLLHAVGSLGMVVRGNTRVSNGAFRASTGTYALALPTFIDVMGLGHSTGTWANKLTMFFCLKSLYAFSVHAGGIRFQLPAHQAAWEIVNCWVRDEDKLLPVNWITTKYGNTGLRVLAREMLQEVHQSKCRTISISFFSNV